MMKCNTQVSLSTVKVVNNESVVQKKFSTRPEGHASFCAFSCTKTLKTKRNKALLRGLSIFSIIIALKQFSYSEKVYAQINERLLNIQQNYGSTYNKFKKFIVCATFDNIELDNNKSAVPYELSLDMTTYYLCVMDD